MLAVSRLPLHLGWIVFGAWIPLLHVLKSSYHSPRQLLLPAMTFSAVYVLIVYYWIGLVTVPGLMGMIMLFTLFYCITFYAMQRVFHTLPRWGYWAFAALAISFEYLQNYGETRFAWFNIGYSLADYNVLIQVVDLIGMSGMAALILAVNILIYHVIRGKRIALTGILAIFLLWIGYGVYCLKNISIQRDDAGIAVMQPSIPQDRKWDEVFYREILETYTKLSHDASREGVRLLIWPEAAIPDYLMRNPLRQIELNAIVNATRMDIFTGFPDFEPAPADYPTPHFYYNAASLFRQDGLPQPVFHKNILVPVAERMLWLKYFPALWKLQFGQANWEFGTELAYYESGGHTFSPSICYELAFADINHRMAIPLSKTKGSPMKCDYLVNVTNDAWFGTSYGPWLHSVMTRFRAVENRIQIYRSANTGISVIVDPMGRELAMAELFKVTNLTAPLYITPRIPLIRRIYRYPLLIVFFALGIFILACFIPRGRTNASRG